MKKAILAVITAAMIAVLICGCFRVENQSQRSTDTEFTTEAVQETTKLDYQSIKNKIFAENVAKDFSTNDISFYVDSVSNTTAFIYSHDSDYILISIGFSDYGNEIDFSFYTSEAESQGYDVLMKGLQSEILGLSLDEQIEILAEYQADKISYEGNGIKITDTGKDSTRLIMIQFNQ